MSDIKFEELKSLIEMTGLSQKEIVRAICEARVSRCSSGCDMKCTNCESGCANGSAYGKK